jgi:sugar/nucleoside kinase (ribokinase family)
MFIVIGTADSTVGAGDGSGAGFVFGVRPGWTPERALRFGLAVAALVVSSPQGVLTSPRRAAVNAFLRESLPT